MRTKNVIASYSETPFTTTIKLNKPGMRYLDELVKLKCAPDLLILRLFPNAKEVTESFGAFNAVRKYLQDEFPLDDSSIECYVVGDGTRPRTGATFAFRTNWEVVSIDPLLKHNSQGIDRLKTESKHIQDCHFKSSGKTLIVCVHSHASLKRTVKAIESPKKTLISIPCCREDDLGVEPDISYYDWNILSEKRVVNIYKL